MKSPLKAADSAGAERQSSDFLGFFGGFGAVGRRSSVPAVSGLELDL
jgi:hypothetical protein